MNSTDFKTKYFNDNTFAIVTDEMLEDMANIVSNNKGTEAPNETTEAPVIVPHSFCPEMGQEKPKGVQITYEVSYSGGYYLTLEDDSLTLKGRGISQVGDGKNHRRNKRTYRATERALNILKGKFLCSYESSLD